MEGIKACPGDVFSGAGPWWPAGGGRDPRRLPVLPIGSPEPESFWKVQSIVTVGYLEREDR